jgi:hypothetical protein
MTRIIPVSALTLFAACWFGSVGCSSSNDPSNGGGDTNGSSGTTATAGTGTITTPTAGSGSTAGGSGNVGTAGSGVGGTTPIAGSSSGGTESGTAGTGTGTAGTGTGTAGSTGSGDFTPLCAGLTTAAGPAPTKNGACSSADPQLCYKTCGPQSVGFKSETCTAGIYAEQSGCSFPPDLDASCYKIPDTIDPSCPATAPQASMPCSVAACTLCNVGGNYLDSTGASKAGYCVCPAAAGGVMGKWSCASTTAWPCPAGKGC